MSAPRKGRNGLVAAALGVLAFGMVGAAFAAVPLYEWFCKRTGFGGTTQIAAAVPAAAIDRGFDIVFDANVVGNLPWKFRPDTTFLTVKAGEVATVTYTIENLSDRAISATAAYNVSPDVAGAYFNKIVCFCFSEQKLAPHEKITVPVTFFVDPAIDTDRNARSLRAISLSYSFFELPPAPAATAKAAGLAPRT